MINKATRAFLNKLKVQNSELQVNCFASIRRCEEGTLYEFSW